MRSLSQVASALVLSVPACAFAGSPTIGISEPSLLSLLAVGGIAVALYGKLRSK